MRRDRQSIGYVVEVDGPVVLLNLSESVRSHVTSHLEGLSSFEQPGDLIAIEAGSEALIARVVSLSFAEPRELHAHMSRRNGEPEPLRQLRASVLGVLRRRDGELEFSAETTRLPALGSECMPLTAAELRATLSLTGADERDVALGHDARNRSVTVQVGLNDLLSRHVAILGATGQGKSHLVADLVQQIAANNQRSRIVIFDVNGEYFPAFSYLGKQVSYTAIGSVVGRNAPSGARAKRIPYYCLGRQGLFRLLLPSERTQAPALRFAIEHLAYVEGDSNGAKRVGGTSNTLFDDCRQDGARAALSDLDQIKLKGARVSRWPHIRAISALAAENYSIEQGKNGPQRNAFNYGHIQPLVGRINSLISDTQFTSVIDVTGGPHCTANANMDLRLESAALVEELFGPAEYLEGSPNIRVIDLSQLTHDLMPLVLGPLLELFAEQLFRRGPNKTHPTMLVLEEAHHYLREVTSDAATGQHSLAYERLAKEGRKFGLSLLVSTQRPSELSPTVLSQCGSWLVFRLTNDSDKKAVVAAAEETASNISGLLPGLGRGELMAFGSAFRIPARVKRHALAEDRSPDSLDPPFRDAWQ